MRESDQGMTETCSGRNWM